MASEFGIRFSEMDGKQSKCSKLVNISSEWSQNVPKCLKMSKMSQNVQLIRISVRMDSFTLKLDLILQNLFAVLLDKDSLAMLTFAFTLTCNGQCNTFLFWSTLGNFKKALVWVCFAIRGTNWFHCFFAGPLTGILWSWKCKQTHG